MQWISRLKTNLSDVKHYSKTTMTKLLQELSSKVGEGGYQELNKDETTASGGSLETEEHA